MSRVQIVMKRVGLAAALFGWLYGYFGFPPLYPTECAAPTWINPTLGCGFVDGLLFRFSNLVSVVLGFLCALPGLALFVWLDLKDSPKDDGEMETGRPQNSVGCPSGKSGLADTSKHPRRLDR